MAAQENGFMLIRERFRIPGEPSPAVHFWEQYTNDLVHAVSMATHDKMQPEKLKHDECSHFVQALRYGYATRPEAPHSQRKSDWSGQTRNLSTGALADSRVVTVGSARTITSPSALPQGALDKYDRPAGF